MPMSISRSLSLCSAFACMLFLSACSENDSANVPFSDIDRSELPTNIVSNQDLSASSSEWTGWGTALDDSSGVSATFGMSSFAISQGGNTIEASIENVEATSLAGDISAGPVSVPVEPGKSYGVAVYAAGARCGAVNLAAHPSGSPENILAEQTYFLNGAPQGFDLYFEVPEGVTSVDLPVQLGMADNLGERVYIDRVTAIPSPIPNGGAEGSILENGSFELSDDEIDKEVNGSSTWGQAGDDATFTLVDSSVTEPQDGEKLVQIEFSDAAGSGDPWLIEGGPVGIPAQAGFTYTAVVWVKGTEGAKANFIVQNSGNYSVYDSQEVIVTSEWQEVRFEATVTDDAVVRLYSQLNFPENAGKTIYVDNYKFIPPDTCPYQPIKNNKVSENSDLFEYEHVTNGSFEESDTEYPGWTFQASGDASASFDVQVTDPIANINLPLVYDADNSIKITINSLGANPSDIQATPTAIYVVPGQTYSYSGYARGATGSVANFVAASQDGATVYEEQLVTFDNIWQQVTFDFTVPENAAVLTSEELAAAGLPEDSVWSALHMAVWLSYPENEGRRFLLDHFSLVPNAAVNGDLENSDETAEGWSWQTPDSIATFALDSTLGEAHTGNNSLRIDIADLPEEGLNLWDVQAGIADIPVAGGRTYYISTRIKGEDGARAKILLDMAEDPFEEFGSVGGEDGNDDDDLPDGIEVGADWQEVTFAVDVPNGVESVRLMAQFGFPDNSRKTIYLDSFRVVSEIPPEDAANTANIVSNGGLENGGTGGWNGNNATLNATTSPEGIYSGNFGLHVTERTSSWNSAQYSLLEAGLVDGGRYQVSSMVKVDGDAADNLKLTLLVRYADGSDDQYIGISATGEADTLSWTNLGGAFDFNPASEVSGVWVYIESDGAETSYFIDDLFITQEYSTNGNLELGDTTGWNAAGASIAVSDIEPFDGTYSLHVTGRTETWNSAQYELINTGVQAGRTYQISAWVKIDGDVADNIKMTVEVQDEDNDTNRYLGLDQSAETLDWVMLSRTYTFAPDGEATSFKVYFEADTATSSYFIDNLVITEVIPPVNITDNGGMELGRTDGWENSGDAVIAVTQSAEGVNSGIYGLEVTGRTQNWHSAQYVLTEAGLVEGATYMASAWVKAIGDTADNIKLTFYFNDGGDNYLGVGQTGEADTLGWTKIEGMFNYAPTSDVSRSHIYIEADGAETEYYVDDLIVKQMYSVNGGLEASDTEATGWNAAGATIAVTTDDANSGNNSLLVSERSAGWHSAQYNLLNSGMEPGKTYDISAWVKIVGDVADNIKMTVEVQDDDNDSNQYLTIAQSSETLTWVKLSSRYTYAPDGDATVFRVYFEADLEDSAYYIDDLVIKEADEVNPF